MIINEKFQNLIHKQKEILNEYEEAVKEFNLDELISQNSQLSEEIKNQKKYLDDFMEANTKLKNENNGLKILVREQMLSEKLNILKVSRQKMNTYFKQIKDKKQNSLKNFENSTNDYISRLSRVINAELSEESKDITKKLDEISEEISKRINQRKQKLGEYEKIVTNDMNNKYNEIEKEELDDEIIKKRIRQNNVEFKIGVNWINKLGMLLILIGVSTALKFTYSVYFPNELKGLFVFVLGMACLIGGDYFAKKEKNHFFMGLTGGGIGILYLSVFHSYFNLNIIGINMAMLLSVLVTGTSIILAFKYNSKTISSIGLIGGFLPFFTYVFSFGLDEDGIKISMGYLLVLNLSTLVISLFKRWSILKNISFVLNIPTLAYLVFEIQSIPWAILYSLITFSMYVAITLAYPLRHKVSVKISDVVVLVLNTIISSIILYALFDKGNYDDLNGLLAIIFCGVYFILGKLSANRLSEDKQTQVIFYLTAYAFGILIIPFQLGVKWLGMGWLIEATLLIIFGFKRKIKYAEIGGWVALSISLLSVLFIDYLSFLFSNSSVEMFYFRYSIVIASMFLILYTYLIEFKKDILKQYTFRANLVKVFKYFTILNFWLFSLFMVNEFYSNVILQGDAVGEEYLNFADRMLYILTTFIVGYMSIKLPYLKDKVSSVFANILFIIANVMLFSTNSSIPVFEKDYDSFKYLAIVILILFNIISFLNVKDLLHKLIKSRRLGFDVVPISLAVYLLANTTGFLITQLNLGQYNAVFTILYLIFGLVLIIYGFVKNLFTTRRFGLGLAIFSLGKLFVYDLAYLELIGKIVSYFTFGIVLLGISYLYQKYSKAYNINQLED